MDFTEEAVDSRLVYRGRILTCKVDRVKLPDGRLAEREVVLHPGAVAIVAMDDAGRLLLVRQYRYPVGRELLEIPAGKLEPGEEPASAARRELEEETGYAAGNLESLGVFYTSPGFSNEKMYLYLATDLRPAAGKRDEDEFLALVRMSLSEARQKVRTGEILDAKTIVGILRAVDWGTVGRV